MWGGLRFGTQYWESYKRMSFFAITLFLLFYRQKIGQPKHLYFQWLRASSLTFHPSFSDKLIVLNWKTHHVFTAIWNTFNFDNRFHFKGFFWSWWRATDPYCLWSKVLPCINVISISKYTLKAWLYISGYCRVSTAMVRFIFEDMNSFRQLWGQFKFTFDHNPAFHFRHGIPLVTTLLHTKTATYKHWTLNRLTQYKS